MGLLFERLSGSGDARLPIGPSGALVGLAAAFAVAAGAMVSLAPLPAFGAVVGAVVVILMATLGRRSAQVFVTSLGVVLIAYAFFGRGVAYVGTGSLFIGEAVFFLGVLAFVLNLGRARFGPFHWLLVAFIAAGLIQTVPYVGPYGLLALRDAVVWGYAFFALAVATTFDPAWFDRLTRAYSRFIPAFLLWVPLAMALEIGFQDSLPGWPGAPVPFIVVKHGDVAVHLAGIAAFLLAGLYADRRAWIPSAIIWVLVFMELAMVGAVSRGGLVAAVVGTAGVLLFVRSTGRLLSAAGIALAGFILLYALNPTIDVGSNQGRALSFSQLVDNVASVILETDRGNLQGTKEWRLAWWEKIVDYTIDGPYFWTGKGFGINLADDDGFQVLADRSLRAPHNGHMAILARGGVPLLALWVAIQAAFAIGLLRAARRARAAGNRLLVQLAAWLFAFWSAALINMTFDVYLEGPQGGIWFWSVIGLGLVVMDAARRTGASRGGQRPIWTVEGRAGTQSSGVAGAAGAAVADGAAGMASGLAAPPGVSTMNFRTALPPVSPTTRAVLAPSVNDGQDLGSRRGEVEKGALDLLPPPPKSAATAADDFFDGLIRRVGGDP